MIEQAMAFQTGREEADNAAWRSAVKKAVMKHDPEGRTAGPIPTFDKSFSMAMREALLQNQEASSASALAPSAAAASGDEYGFADVIDMINPLQHIPVIGSVYRSLTGDTMKGMSSIIGGGIFAGPVGAIAGTINVITKDRTGKDIGENIASAMGFGTPYETQAKPDISYSKEFFAEEERMASANNKTVDGKKNFAAAAKYARTWNT